MPIIVKASIMSEDIIEALTIIGKCKAKKPEEYEDAVKLVKARIQNLEGNLHIEIDMERIDDRSKALSYIGIEIAEALKGIPTPVEEPEKVQKTQKVEKVEKTEEKSTVGDTYIEETRFEVKPSLWERIKKSKFVRTLSYVFKIRVVLDVPALPEGRGENN